MVIFLGEPVSAGSLSYICFTREPLEISGMGFSTGQ